MNIVAILAVVCHQPFSFTSCGIIGKSFKVHIQLFCDITSLLYQNTFHCHVGMCNTFHFSVTEVIPKHTKWLQIK
jgi:hypothetical protein